MHINDRGTDRAVQTPTTPARRDQRFSAQTSLRDVMSRFATGVTVLTAGGEYGHGMTANAFNSVSLEPPLVMCCVSRTARMHESITSAGSFAVSILADEQRDLARYFADRGRPRGLAQFDGVDCRRGPHTDAPLLEGSLAWLECELVDVYGGGDHSIFLGEVLSSIRGNDSRALLFCGGQYHLIDAPDRRSAL